MLAIISCQKKDDFGLDFIPESERLNVEICDTFSLKTYSFYEDTFPTSNPTYSLLGSYVDPIFGKTTASFITQIRTSSNNLSYPKDAIAEGLTLHLDCNTIYGDKTVPMTVKIYRVTDDFEQSKIYYGKDIDVSKYTEEICSQSIDPKEITADNKILRIEFPKSFADYMLKIDSLNMLDNSKFISFFKGLYITVSQPETDGSILSFDLLSSKSFLELKYWKSDTASKISKSNYLLNSACARINIFKHEYDGTDIKTAIEEAENSTNPFNYIQGIGGVKTVVKFPNLNSWFKKGEVAIVKAQLIIKVDEESTSTNFPATKQLDIRRIDDKLYALDDALNSTFIDFGGEHSDTTKSYIFNIPLHIQSVLNGVYENNGLMLYAAIDKINASRVVINSAYNVEDRMKLKITYIKIK